MKKHIFTFILSLGVSAAIFAGNPDRQGEAGAYQLLINPWARNVGLHAMNTSMVRGVDAMHLNPAGISRINSTEINICRTNYFAGTGISVNGLGLAQSVGKGGALGISLMSINVGDIPVTTESNPEGTGATFSPNMYNLGVGYAYTFRDKDDHEKVSVGATIRVVSESTQNISASAISLDAGVQYVAGDKNQFKFGIALRNIGSKMRFEGQALSNTTGNPGTDYPYKLTYFKAGQGFELPSMLQIGMSYDLLFGKTSKLALLGNFTSNAFSRDQIGAGAEFTLSNVISLRGGYRYEIGSKDATVLSVVGPICAGASFDIPLRRETKNTLSIDYGYQMTNTYGGSHTIGVRIGL
jgi:hypothetical protein